jgi:4-hydroxy-2-oxoheptanedioate aldolase
MIRTNLAKAKILNGGTACGVFCTFFAPAVVEMVGHLGFDFALLDAEHGPSGTESCEHMVRAAETVGIAPLIRVAVNIRQNILRYLDIGSLGVQLPMVSNAAEAKAVVDAVRYPPLGKRGLAGVRAADYALTIPLKDYTVKANQELLVVVQIETMEAVKNLDEILAVDGIDVFFIGPTDLSSSMGYPGQVNHPEVSAMIKSLVGRIRAAKMPAGTVAYNLEALARAKELGFQYIVHNVIAMLSRSGKEYLEKARS